MAGQAVAIEMSYRELSDNPIAKTKKLHFCEWCSKPINAGEKAHSRTFVYNNIVYSTWQHPECDLAYQIVAKRDGGAYIEWQPGDYERGGTECIT